VFCGAGEFSQSFRKAGFAVIQGQQFSQETGNAIPLCFGVLQNPIFFPI
jgi:hypothetical protein